MVEIPLTQGKVAIVDDEMGWLKNRKWHEMKCGEHWYANSKIKLYDGTWRNMFLHHVVIGHPLMGFEVDHINGDGFLNTRDNLRHVTHRENMSNLKCHRDNNKTSGFIGVCWHKKEEKWRAQIHCHGKVKFLGRYADEEEASKAYKLALSKGN